MIGDGLQEEAKLSGKGGERENFFFTFFVMAKNLHKKGKERKINKDLTFKDLCAKRKGIKNENLFLLRLTVLERT